MHKRASIRSLLFVIVIFLLCIAIGYFEFTRARAGNTRSWLYTFEWPFFGGFGIYIWWRLRNGDWERIQKYLKDEDDKNDDELMAWREYQEKIERESPPGGPPT